MSIKSRKKDALLAVARTTKAKLLSVEVTDPAEELLQSL